jgi:hypothetical protein
MRPSSRVISSTTGDAPDVSRYPPSTMWATAGRSACRGQRLTMREAGREKGRSRQRDVGPLIAEEVAQVAGGGEDALVGEAILFPSGRRRRQRLILVERGVGPAVVLLARIAQLDVPVEHRDVEAAAVADVRAVEQQERGVPVAAPELEQAGLEGMRGPLALPCLLEDGSSVGGAVELEKDAWDLDEQPPGTGG